MSNEITLSAAIRLGAMLRPQAYNSNAKDGSCALRAAAEAMGIEDCAGPIDGCLSYNVLELAFPILHHSCEVPEFGFSAAHGFFHPRLMSFIWFANDSLHWDRERTADFVERFEAQVSAEESTNGLPVHLAASVAPASGLPADLALAEAILSRETSLRWTIRQRLLANGWHEEDGYLISDSGGFWRVSFIDAPTRWKLEREGDDGRPIGVESIGTTERELWDALAFRAVMEPEPEDAGEYEAADSRLTEILECGGAR